MMAPRAICAVLALYPYDFRARFEAEVLVTIEQALQCVDRPRRSAAVWVWEIGGLAIGAAREWIAKLTSDPVERFRSLPDCRFMRPVGITRTEWAAGLTHVTIRQAEL